MRIQLPPDSTEVVVEQISTPSLGNHTYVITSGGDAVVIDPQRDFERIDDFIPDGHRLVAVCETHVHNDYVSGGFWMAKDHGSAYVIPSGSDAPYAHRPVAPGDRIEVGSVWLDVNDTPGHTFHHASYALTGPSGPVALFTGGSMLVAAVGRSDLLGEQSTDELLHLQYESVRSLAADFSGEVVVAPTHGAGSFCSASPVAGTTSTIEAERRHNPVCTSSSVEAFVRTQRAGYGLYPDYYSHMAEENLRPADRAELGEIPAMSAAEAIESGCQIVDVRPFEEYAERHIAGSIAAPPSDQDATYVAWTLPWNTPIVVIGEPEAAAAFRIHLARLGWDEIMGVISDLDVIGLPDANVGTNTIATFSDLVAKRPDQIVDARDPLDHAQGMIRGAIPAHVSVIAKQGVSVDGPDVWVHCGGGYRAMVATGFLERLGYRVTTVVDSAPPDLTTLI
jgi:glyoxylase-like metal-dependent hydrolase (beta-lactamase superfamily II)/rhodanese-related sulfurtransferase